MDNSKWESRITLAMGMIFFVASILAYGATNDIAQNDVSGNSVNTVGQFPVSSLFDSKMSGISFKDVDGFWDKWHLVIVRYRQDTKEMRFIYANDIAWERIQDSRKNGTEYPPDYPEGSMFGKVSYSLKEDLLLTSSLMPDHVLRYQIMVKQTSKDSSNHGWGYAIFSQTGTINTLPNNVKQTVDACATCHEIASSRGYVFIGKLDATPTNSHLISKTSISTGSVGPNYAEPKFAKRALSELGQEFSFIAETEVEVAEMQHSQMFSGTLNELSPLLIKHNKESGLPTILMSTDRKLWSVVYKDPENDKCIFIRTRMDLQFLTSEERIRSRHVCH